MAEMNVGVCSAAVTVVYASAAGGALETRSFSVAFSHHLSKSHFQLQMFTIQPMFKKT